MTPREEEIRQDQVRDFVAERITYKDSRVITLIKESAVLGVEWADTHPKNPWRDARQDPPKDEQQVYVSWGDYNVKGIGIFCQDEKCWQVGWLGSDVKVNYWMPIPELPKGGEA